MIEFGSDFHRCDSAFHGAHTISTLLPSPQFYASGRMALLAIVRREGWKRLWVPAYFCHEIIDAWKSQIEVCLYDDYPLEEHDEALVRSLPYKDGDALLRMNFFGLRARRTNVGIPVPVIEDHSHALTSDWALNSDADWCIASLRKSLPLAFGGIIWSPKHLPLPTEPASNSAYDLLSETRYQAMEMKTRYLQSGGDKEAFRSKFIATEEGLDQLTDIAAIDEETIRILSQLDIVRWNEQKHKNHALACHMLNRFEIIGREASTPFSLIVLMPSEDARKRFKSFLIQNAIFPATLWNIPEEVPFARCVDFGKRMLSLHCDARYTERDIQQMCDIINSYDSIH